MNRSARYVSAMWILGTLAGCGLMVGGPAMARRPLPVPTEEIVLRDALVIGRIGQYGRAPVHRDAIEAQIVAGRWSSPKSGDTVTLPDGSTRTWETATAAENGWIRHQALRGGYAYVSVEADAERVMILEAAAHSLVYVNGWPRAGDPYRTDKVRLPVLLRAGSNSFLFACRRGRLRAKLTTPDSVALLDTRDATLPDLIVGEKAPLHGAVVVINASTEVLENLQIEAIDGDAKSSRTALPPIPPLSIRKVGFQLEGPDPTEVEARQVELRLVRTGEGEDVVVDTADIELPVRRPKEKHKRTFISEIDGSVQYYAVTPAQPAEGDEEPPALFLTLHGAGVEATGQANAYSPKTWGHVVAPTNRRHFGFDWEDWGRLDALEVLELAAEQFDTDPRRTYLTGHSMGGHGVWHVGVTFPDRFAAIGPSAGWVSFWSYAGAARYEDATPMEQMLMRASAPSDTLSLSRNYLQHGVYILHGEKDDNVPVKQARTMRAHLAEFHADFAYYERPGAGHWWGSACVDWEPLFAFFKHHTLPEAESVRHVEFVTASPGVSASSRWVTIEAQIEQFKPSKVDIRFDPGARRFTGSTENVARLSLDLEHVEAGTAIQLELDGQKIDDVVSPAGTDRVWLARAGDSWSNVSIPAAELKGPQRYGPFKEAFRNRVMFVYGTAGTPEENAWALAKARYDAETFWYRGNASIDVIADTAFDATAEPDRNVILYGNAGTHAAWDALLADSPVQVRRGLIRIGERELAGDDLGCLLVRPRPGSDRALVGVVTGSGLPGMRLTERLPYFVSGIAYPDCIVLGPEVLSEGTAGVRTAGFFGRDWTVTSGEFVWQAPPAPTDEGTSERSPDDG